ncbi:MAG: hypothetical protein GVY26_15155, partial [Bacteroidetes bacterium]|nr:hypothetical protein [Bacteroidota bacterium]
RLPNSDFQIPTSHHDFHISKCLMHYRPEQQALQISMHIFLDDLELALRERGHDKLYLCTKKEAAGANELVEAYLRDEFQLTLNGELRDFNFVGKEISDDLAAVWCYLEITDLPRLESLELRYSILMDTYDDQKNLASLERPGEEVGTLLFQKGNAVKKATF